MTVKQQVVYCSVEGVMRDSDSESAIMTYGLLAVVLPAIPDNGRLTKHNRLLLAEDQKVSQG